MNVIASSNVDHTSHPIQKLLSANPLNIIMSTLTQKSLWSSPKGYSFKQLDIPTPGSGEVLIKNVAVASNPKVSNVARLFMYG